MLISVIGFGIGFSTLSNFFQFNAPQKQSDEAIKLLSYNVRLFDLYNWTENKLTRNKIFKLLEREDADIYCFQEFYRVDQSNAFVTRDTMITFLRANQFREAYTHEMRGKQFFGVATFSAFPIINSGKITFNNDINNVCLFTDIVKGPDTVRVYNVHLSSIRFSNDDYSFIQNMEKQDDSQELERGLRTIYSRLSQAFVKRSVQTKKVLKHIKTSPYPVIVSGDFNDTPVSYCYHEFTESLMDAFKQSGNGISNTYIGSMPSYRIDYIFHDDHFKTINYKKLSEKYSDHYPITAKIILNP